MKVLPKRASGCYWNYELPSPTPASDATPGLSIDVHARETVTVLRLSGRLDSTMDENLMKVFTDLVEKGRASVLLDMAGLKYLNSRGVSVFVAVLDQLREKGGDLKLARLNPSCRLVLERLGLNAVMQSFETVEEGIAAFDTPIADCLAGGGLETFVAGRGAKVYHVSRCTSAGRLRNRVSFPSQKEAREAGLRPCRRCL